MGAYTTIGSKAYSGITTIRTFPSGMTFLANTSTCWALKSVHTLPAITATQLIDGAKWRGGSHGLDGWRCRELRLLLIRFGSS
jgi:hypothetical protein